MKTIGAVMAAGDSPNKMFYGRVSPAEQGSQVSVRQQAKSIRCLKLPQWSGGKKVEAPKDGRIVFYSRTSVVEQGKEGSRKKQQIKAANACLKHLGLSPLSRKDVYLDHCSGADLNRPALSRLIDCVKKGEIQTIVVLSIDRLGRNRRELFALIDILNSHNVSLHSADGLDTSSPTGKFGLSFMRFFYEYENSIRKENCLKGRLHSMKYKRDRGLTRTKKP